MNRLKIALVVLALCTALHANAADVKISALPNASTPLAGTEVLPIVQSSTTKNVPASAVAALATKTTVGLPNVDNTSDANKPVSTAQATADALVASNAAADATTKASAAQAAAIAASVPTTRTVNSHALSANVVVTAADIGLGRSIVVLSADSTRTETSGDVVLLVDATSGPVTITLPTTSGNSARFSIQKTDASTNTVTVVPHGSETIVDASTAVITRRYETPTFVPYSTNWSVL